MPIETLSSLIEKVAAEINSRALLGIEQNIDLDRMVRCQDSAMRIRKVAQIVRERPVDENELRPLIDYAISAGCPPTDEDALLLWQLIAADARRNGKPLV